MAIRVRDDKGNADAEDPCVKVEVNKDDSVVPTTIHLLIYGTPELETVETRKTTYKRGV